MFSPIPSIRPGRRSSVCQRVRGDGASLAQHIDAGNDTARLTDTTTETAHTTDFFHRQTAKALLGKPAVAPDDGEYRRPPAKALLGKPAVAPGDGEYRRPQAKALLGKPAVAPGDGEHRRPPAKARLGKPAVAPGDGEYRRPQAKALLGKPAVAPGDGEYRRPQAKALLGKPAVAPGDGEYRRPQAKALLGKPAVAPGDGEHRRPPAKALLGKPAVAPGDGEYRRPPAKALLGKPAVAPGDGEHRRPPASAALTTIVCDHDNPPPSIRLGHTARCAAPIEVTCPDSRGTRPPSRALPAGVTEAEPAGSIQDGSSHRWRDSARAPTFHLNGAKALLGKPAVAPGPTHRTTCTCFSVPAAC